MNNYDFHDNLILRSPILPYQTSFNEEELMSLFNSPLGRESLFLASPDLLKEFERFVKGEITETRKRNKILRSLMKYAVRMHTRCTPFGLFAGCSIANWNDKTEIVLSKDDYVRKTRLDMNFLCALVTKIIRDDTIKRKLKYYPNTSLYSVGDNYRYIEYSFKSGRRQYQISAVGKSTYLEQIIETAINGSTINELTHLLVSAEISFEEAGSFIETVIENQLLVSELEPAVYGENQLTALIKVLSSKEPDKANNAWLGRLKEIDRLLAATDESFCNNEELYERIKTIIESFDLAYDSNHLFQTDLFTEQGENLKSFNRKNQVKLIKGLRALNRLTPKTQQPNLEAFKRKFTAQYEDAEMPLAVVLDNEAGIGYAGNDNLSGTKSPVLNGLILGGGVSQAQAVNFGTQERFWLPKLVKAALNNETTINITLDELNWEAENHDNLPDTMSIMFNVLKNEKIRLNFAGGASAINLIGRFASGNAEINQLANAIAEHEKSLHPGKVLAEIAHLPESRTGNILMRPKFRTFEIPFLSGVENRDAHQIGMNDLYVSVKNNRVILRSRRLNKEVLPRLGNAHNYPVRSLPVYHFLCDLQFQDTQRASLGFSWGVLRSSFDFLPRVEIDGVILSPAQWKVTTKAADELRKLNESVPHEACQWCKKWNLPEEVVFAEGDNELVIDFNSALSVMMLKERIGKQNEVWFYEAFASNEGIVENGNGAGFANQFVATLLKREINQPNLLVKKSAEKLRRSFSVGSEWLYYKVYTGLKTADAVLEEIIHPVARKLEDEKHIDKWFFIRYTDPDPHLRVRFHFQHKEDVGKAIEYIEHALSNSPLKGHIRKLQTDTYQREIERYGEETMVLSESLFYEDSKAIAGLVELIEGTEGDEIRWLYGVALIDASLNDFGYSLDEKFDLIGRLKKGFGEEFNAGKHLNKHLDKNYRSEKEKINAFLQHDLSYYPHYGVIFQLVQQRSRANVAIVEGINSKIGAGVTRRKNELLSSYLHMTINRLFRNQQRAVELVLYTYLWKYYKAKLAMEKRKTALLESA